MMSVRKKTHNLTFIDNSTPEGKFRTALYWERGFELAFEGQRKYDLIRWGVLGKALKLFRGRSVIVNPEREQTISGLPEFYGG